MNNVDKFKLALRGDPLEAARLALEFSSGCSSKANAWAWANNAKEAAARVGVTLDAGDLSWPELDRMEAQLDAAMAALSK